MQVLKRVMQEEKALSFFNEPVDPDALGIPEYRQIVKARSSQHITALQSFQASLFMLTHMLVARKRLCEQPVIVCSSSCTASSCIRAEISHRSILLQLLQ